MSTPERKRSLQDLKARGLDDVLDAELSELTGFKRWAHLALGVAVTEGMDFFGNLMMLQVMALVLRTLLSVVPLLAVVLSMLKRLGVPSRMEPALAGAL